MNHNRIIKNLENKYGEKVKVTKTKVYEYDENPDPNASVDFLKFENHRTQ